jgi:hypothetical protein
MRLFSWLRNWKQADPAERRPQRSACRRATFRPRLELLEDRNLPSSYTAATTSALIADINAANKAGGTNTITLAANTTFDLTAVNNTTDGASGLPVISSKKGGDNLTIIGNGDTIERSTAAGTPAFRLLDVATGNSLTLQNVTLQNGLAQGSGYGSDGAAIFNQGTVTVSGSTLSNNSAAWEGGGIFNFLNGTLTVSGSTLSGNTAYIGGGIYNLGTLTVSGSTLSGNSAYNAGGIYTSGGTATITGCILSGNTATLAGGGIYINGDTVTISGSTLSGNSASKGGGIYISGGTVTVKNSSTITGNSAPVGFGADVYNQGVLYLDSTSKIGILDGNPAVPI